MTETAYIHRRIETQEAKAKAPEMTTTENAINRFWFLSQIFLIR